MPPPCPAQPRDCNVSDWCFLTSQGSRFRLIRALVGHLRAIMSHLGALMLPRWGPVGAKFGYVGTSWVYVGTF
eukprot:8782820-Karenia_brevis.AAC.1